MSDAVEKLIADVLKGDISGFDKIAKTYHPSILAIINYLHPDKATANDVMQEILLTIYKKLDCYKPNTHFESWIREIARKVCYAHRRRFLKRVNKHREYEKCYKEDLKTPEIVHFNILFDKLTRYLSRMKPIYKNTLKMFYYENKSIKEISQKCDMSEEQVRVRLYRGRKMLEEKLKELI